MLEQETNAIPVDFYPKSQIINEFLGRNKFIANQHTLWAFFSLLFALKEHTITCLKAILSDKVLVEGSLLRAVKVNTFWIL